MLAQDARQVEEDVLSQELSAVVVAEQHPEGARSEAKAHGSEEGEESEDESSDSSSNEGDEVETRLTSKRVPIRAESPASKSGESQTGSVPDAAFADRVVDDSVEDTAEDPPLASQEHADASVEGGAFRRMQQT